MGQKTRLFRITWNIYFYVIVCEIWQKFVSTNNNGSHFDNVSQNMLGNQKFQNVWDLMFVPGQTLPLYILHIHMDISPKYTPKYFQFLNEPFFLHTYYCKYLYTTAITLDKNWKPYKIVNVFFNLVTWFMLIKLCVQLYIINQFAVSSSQDWPQPNPVSENIMPTLLLRIPSMLIWTEHLKTNVTSGKAQALLTRDDHSSVYPAQSLSIALAFSQTTS